MLRMELPGKRKWGKAKKEVYGCGEVTEEVNRR